MSHSVTRKSFRRSNEEIKQAPVIFITGTDTGVGKTLLTALLLHHLRQSGLRALAMKPFCSGGLHDVDLLFRVQEGELSREEVNPFYFEEPVAPLVAARYLGRRILPGDVLQRISRIRRRCECLLIEGSGGLMVPLGENFLVADLIAALDCNVVVAGQNKLGVINHALLTSRMLAYQGIKRIKIALLGGKQIDLSARTNAKVLRELLWPVKVASLPFLGIRASTASALKKNYGKVKKTLALISAFDTFYPLFKRSRRRLSEKTIDSPR